MAVSVVLRILMSVAGCLLLVVTFVTFAKKKITELAGLGWCLISVIMILISIITPLAGWSKVMSGRNYIAFFVLFFVIMLGMYATTVTISVLKMKNQELAMHVSLLNQENEQILLEIRKLKRCMDDAGEGRRS